MHRFGRKLLAANTWTTAILTLVAGIPHFDCRCPDGSVKPFGLGFLSRAAGCCCGEARPVTEERTGAQSARPVCPLCKKHRQQPSIERAGHARLESAGCVRTLVRPAPFAASQAKVAVVRDLAAQPSLPADVVAPPSTPVTASFQATFWPDSLPPPADRVITLQRFVI